MIHQCQYCLHYIHLAPGHATFCQCGALYTVQMVTSNSTSTAVNKDYDSLHRQAVPDAFYKAFEGEEAWQ